MTALPKLKDKRGKGLQVGSYVRVEIPKLKRWRGTVLAIFEEGLEIRDEKMGWLRHVRLENVIVIRTRGKKEKRNARPI